MAYSEQDVRKISKVLIALVAAIAVVGLWVWIGSDNPNLSLPIFVWALGRLLGVL
jgi:fatty acid desaturase